MDDDYTVEDTAIYSGKPTHNYGDHRYATVGYLDNIYKEGYYMVKFPKIATTAFYDDDEVVSAYFHIYTASGGNGELGYSIIEAFKKRGAKCVIGFDCNVGTDETEDFQIEFCNAIISSSNGISIYEAINAGKQAMEAYGDNVVVEGNSDSYLE